MPGRLLFKDEKSPSRGPKTFILSLCVLGIGAAGWLPVFGAGEPSRPGDPGRRVVLLSCAGIYLLRAAVTLCVFVKRKISWWEAALGGGLIAFVLFAFLSEGFASRRPLGIVDAVGALLYLAGSWVGTRSEYSRHFWKEQPGNRGRLYTEGLFRFSRHINYFGDLLLFGGFAVLTGERWAGIVPLAMALNFVLLLIPAQDAYLASRYGEEFEEYARRTKKLIPMVY